MRYEPSPALPSRRALLAAAASLLMAGRARSAKPKHEQPEGLRVEDWMFDAKRPFTHRALVLRPSHLAEGERVPTLVLLHGLGEAKQGAEAGVYAWLDRYGLGSSYDRLRRPPIAQVTRRGDLTEARAKELSESLEREPFKGLVIVCPYTPNVWSYASTAATLDALSDFATGALLDRVAQQIPEALLTPAQTGIDGCSLGGFVALELFARKPERYGAVGVVQPAISSRNIPRYVDAIGGRAAGAPSVHVESSLGDPYLGVSRELAASLVKKNISCDLIVPPGPHDQPFLREIGTLELLLWHDRALRKAP